MTEGEPLWASMRSCASLHGGQELCKICAAVAPAFGELDFNRSCATPESVVLPASGMAIEYNRCPDCEFLFSAAFDGWTSADFLEKIYNEQYLAVDPDYVERRPAASAVFLCAAVLCRKSVSQRARLWRGKRGIGPATAPIADLPQPTPTILWSANSPDCPIANIPSSAASRRWSTRPIRWPPWPRWRSCWMSRASSSFRPSFSLRISKPSRAWAGGMPDLATGIFRCSRGSRWNAPGARRLQASAASTTSPCCLPRRCPISRSHLFRRS